VPEEHSEYSDRNNANDKVLRLASTILVTADNRPGGFAHAKTPQMPASDQTSPGIDKDFVNLCFSGRYWELPNGTFGQPLNAPFACHQPAHASA
jgi:hypothetical protein